MADAATPFPLSWPAGHSRRAPAARKPGKFNSKERVYRGGGNGWIETKAITVADALRRLQGELDRIGARYAVVSSNVEVRLDGLPRSGQREPEDSGVAVYFQLNGKPHCLPCDTYIKVAHNIAAVAAHIEATRAIERHGVATVAEMFAGFAALPAPDQKRPWRDVLGLARVGSPITREIVDAAYRSLARERHPDQGGSDAMMAELNRARDDARRDLG